MQCVAGCVHFVCNAAYSACAVNRVASEEGGEQGEWVAVVNMGFGSMSCTDTLQRTAIRLL